ncbi:hypothetical protein EV426DRAFT_615741 [Tirmania nivea]|nr:hypothetical protein EV426DRAFT_615741 [Tirmania nivea]
MPVQTRSHGRPADPSLTTRIKKALNGTSTKPRAAPKKSTTPRKKTAGITKTTHSESAHKHKHKPGLVDKIEGVALKIEGAITRRPGVKAAGTKKIRGTDGKNSNTPQGVKVPH